MTKEIKKSIEKNELINDEDYLDYIYKLLEKYKLINRINGLLLSNDDSSGYNQNEKILIFNPEDILLYNVDNTIPTLNDLITDEERDNYHVNNPNSANIYNLYTIQHELQHIKQNILLKSTNHSLLKNLITIDVASKKIDNDYFKSYYYEHFHDRFLFEYNAEVIGYMKTLEELKGINFIQKDLIKTNEIIAKHLLYLYSDIGKRNIRTCPVHNMFRLFNHITSKCDEHNQNIFIDMKLKKFKDLEKPKEELEKLKYGLTIKKETFNYIKKVSNSKIKTLNIFENI